MSANSVAEFAIKLVSNLPQIASAGMSIFQQVQQGVAALTKMRDENRGPTNEEYEMLRQQNANAHIALQALGGATNVPKTEEPSSGPTSG